MNARNPDATSTAVEVVFRVTDPSYPFVGPTQEGDCRIALERMLPRGGGEYAEFFRVAGIDPDRVEEVARDHPRIHDARTVVAGHESGLFEFTVTTDEACPARDLAERGAIPTQVSGADGRGEIVAHIVDEETAPEVVSTFLEDNPGIEFVSKSETAYDRPLFSAGELESVVEEALTQRQRDALLAAYEAGYYAFPREATVDEIAADLGVASSTCCEHLRKAERKMLSLIYEQG